VEIVDANGKTLAMVPVQAKGEWMTTDFVPFEETIEFTPTTETGKIIFHKDNPSGEPQLDDKREISVRFDLTGVPKRMIKIYNYDESKDKDQNGNILCSAAGLVAVDKEIVRTNTPIQDAVRTQLSTMNLDGVELTGANLTAGALTLAFKDPNNKTSGGSCRVSILRAQIEASAKQFGGVSQVKYSPAEVFQP
jgi:hypothetical protein